jgi:hypothetical protein
VEEEEEEKRGQGTVGRNDGSAVTAQFYKLGNISFLLPPSSLLPVISCHTSVWVRIESRYLHRRR